MQTDLQLLFLIIGMVVGILVIFKAMRERQTRATPPKVTSKAPVAKSMKTAPRERGGFQKKVIEKTSKHHIASRQEVVMLHVAGEDPLLDREEKKVVGGVPSRSEVSPKVVDPVAKREELITLVLIPRNAGAFAGSELRAVFEAEKYHYGNKKLFECHEHADPKQRLLYSIASLVEPGIFEYHQMPYESYKGVLLWMVFRSDMKPEVFEKMLGDAKRVAEKCNATLCDEWRQQLTIPSITKIRLRVQECSYCESDNQKTH